MRVVCNVVCDASCELMFVDVLYDFVLLCSFLVLGVNGMLSSAAVVSKSYLEGEVNICSLCREKYVVLKSICYVKYES